MGRPAISMTKYSTMYSPLYFDVGARHLVPEWMDQPGLEINTHRTALNAMARINSLAFTHRTYWKTIHAMAKRQSPVRLRVLDVACGGGDVATRLALLAQHAELPVTVDGCDISPTAMSHAQELADSMRAPCRFFQFDVLRDKWPTDYDVITTSLFLHHLSNFDAVEVLARMAAATRQAVLVNDLIRSRAGYFLARFGAPLLTRSPIVHFDAPRSVAGAFTSKELIGLAHKAGMLGATISRCWMSRMLLEMEQELSSNPSDKLPLNASKSASCFRVQCLEVS